MMIKLFGLILVILLGAVASVVFSDHSGNVVGEAQSVRQKAPQEIVLDEFWQTKLATAKFELVEFQNLDLVWTKREVRANGGLEQAIVRNEMHFDESFIKANGDCNNLSVDSELLFGAVSVRVHQAIFDERNIAQATAAVLKSLNCGWEKTGAAENAILLAKNRPNSPQVKEMLAAVEAALEQDYNSAQPDDVTDFAKTVLALQAISCLNRDNDKATLWLRRYADLQTNLSPLISYEIYQSLMDTDNMVLAAVKVGDNVAAIFYSGEIDTSTGDVSRDPGMEFDRQLAMSWFNRAGLTDEEAKTRMEAIRAVR